MLDTSPVTRERRLPLVCVTAAIEWRESRRALQAEGPRVETRTILGEGHAGSGGGASRVIEGKRFTEQGDTCSISSISK